MKKSKTVEVSSVKGFYDDLLKKLTNSKCLVFLHNGQKKLNDYNLSKFIYARTKEK